MKVKLIIIGEDKQTNIALLEAIRFAEVIDTSFLIDGYCLYYS